MTLGRNIKKDKLIPSKERDTDTQSKEVKPKKKVKSQASKIANEELVLSHKSLKVISEEASRERQRMRLKFANDLDQMRGKRVQLMKFALAGSDYALDIKQVKEVVVITTIDKVPGVPHYVKGVSSVKGNMVAVIDIVEKFGLKKGQDAVKDLEKDKLYALIIQGNGVRVAALLEEMPSTMVIDGDDVTNIDSVHLEMALHETYIKGLIEKERTIALIDAIDLVESKEIRAVAEMVKKRE